MKRPLMQMFHSSNARNHGPCLVAFVKVLILPE